MATEAYAENKGWIRSSRPDLLEISEMGRLITILNVMVGCHLAFFLRKGQNFLIDAKNIPVDNFLIAVYDLWFSSKSSN